MSTPSTNPINISLPQGKTVIVNFATNTTVQQSYSISDSSGTVVCKDSGTGTGPTAHSSQTFTANEGGKYSVSIIANGSNEKVLMSESSVVYDGTVYAQSYTFVSEDASDNDYNDTFLSINWFQKNT